MTACVIDSSTIRSPLDWVIDFRRRLLGRRAHKAHLRGLSMLAHPAGKARV